MRTATEKYARGNKIVALHLENEHKYKLHEMCNNMIDNNNPSSEINIFRDIIRIPKQGINSIIYDNIHWFELCTTHLCFHIFSNPLEYIKYTIEYSMSIEKKTLIHPIDYMYEEYLIVKDLFKNVFNTQDIKIKTKDTTKKGSISLYNCSGSNY